MADWDDEDTTAMKTTDTADSDATDTPSPPDIWPWTRTHPSVKDRIDRIMEISQWH